ncbi:hypothetical protein BJX96DRAFT_62595 [Aspergillus floccosus]
MSLRIGDCSLRTIFLFLPFSSCFFPLGIPFSEEVTESNLPDAEHERGKRDRQMRAARSDRAMDSHSRRRLKNRTQQRRDGGVQEHDGTPLQIEERSGRG